VALVRDGKSGKLTWVAPQPNGSAISAYRVFRRRGTNVTTLGPVASPGFGEPLLGGEVGYQVSAIGANGAESARSGEVTLARGEPLLKRLTVGPMPYDPRAGRLNVSFDLREAARVTWRVVDAEGKALTDEATVQLAQGPGALVWDGRNRSGAVAEPGVYRVELKATAAAETDAQAKAFPVNWAAIDTGSGALAGPGAAGGGTAAAAGLGGGTTGAASGTGGSGAAGTVSGGGSAGSSPGSTVSDPAGGHGNNGVRDHGVGEGRDGAGQGKGQGSDHGGK
jgi:hypothetical protein